MKNEYAVLHKKDLDGPTLKENKAQRELYDRMTAFSTMDKAAKYAMSVLQERPVIMKSASLMAQGKEQVRYPETPYVIAAYFETKYGGHSYGGSFDYVSTYEVERCNRDQLEDKLMKIAEEGPSKLYWGLELKLIPSLGMFNVK